MKNSIKLFKKISAITIVLGVAIFYYIISKIMVYIFPIGYSIFNKINISKINIKEILIRNSYIISTVTGLVVLLILGLIFLLTKESLLKRCNFKFISFYKLIYIIIFTIGFVFLNSVFIGLLQPFFKSYGVVQKHLANARMSILPILCVTILIPIIEEILFRGIILGILRKNFKIKIAIIVQALIFAIMHGNILQGIYAFISAVIFAYIYLYSNSLYGNIVSHITFNIFGTLVMPFLIAKIHYISVFILIGLVFISFGIFKLRNNKTKINIY